MKRSTSLFFVVILMSTSCFYCRETKIKAPDRLPSIPEKAVWSGGVDGGNWFELSRVLSKNTFKIKIYNDFSGGLIADNIFVLNPDCTVTEVDSITLIKSFDFYDGERILLDLDIQGCSLIMK